MRLVAGRYRLLELLGRGGFGAVWRAVDEVLRREVAVKELELAGDTGAELLARAVTEARSAAALDHPAIVTVHDIVVDGDRPWIIMKLVRGRNLHQLVSASGPLTETETARHGLNLLDALTSAHVRGVVHRDVKPENVMIDERGEALLTDFSIAKMVGVDPNTSTGMIMGTPGFVPPERARSGHTGPAGDLFALGATLYYAVEGRAPFRLDSDDALANLLASARQEHEPPRRAPRLAEVLGGLLVKDPERRLSAQHARLMLTDVAQPARPGRLPAVPAQPQAKPTVADGPPEQQVPVRGSGGVVAPPGTAGPVLPDGKGRAAAPVAARFDRDPTTPDLGTPDPGPVLTPRARRRAIGYQVAGGVLVVSGTVALFGGTKVAPVGTVGLLSGVLTGLAGWLMARHPRARPEPPAPAPTTGGGNRRDTIGRQFSSASATRMPRTGKRIMFAGLVFGDAAMVAVGYDTEAGAGLGVWAGLVLVTGLGVYLYGRAKRAGHVRPKLKRFDTPSGTGALPAGSRPGAGTAPRAGESGGGAQKRRSTHGGTRSRKGRPPAGAVGAQPGGVLVPWPGGAVGAPAPYPGGAPVVQRWAVPVAPRYPGVEFVPVNRTPVKGRRRRRLMLLGFVAAVGGGAWAASHPHYPAGSIVAAFGLLLFLLGTFRRRVG